MNDGENGFEVKKERRACSFCEAVKVAAAGPCVFRFLVVGDLDALFADVIENCQNKSHHDLGYCSICDIEFNAGARRLR